MPKSWYIFSENYVKDDDSDETKAQKLLNQRLCASKKPYFFCYNYLELKQEFDNYVKTTSESIYVTTGKNISELLRNDGNLPEEDQKIVDSYKRHLPLDVSPSTMNRICWAIENEFDGTQILHDVDFDYSIYKSNVAYTEEEYQLIKRKIELYKKKKKQIGKNAFVNNECIEDTIVDVDQFNMELEKDCFSICSNKQELCEILLDICYSEMSDKSIVWDLCGDVIVSNLINKSGRINYPARSKNGDFWCGGCNFIMKTLELGGENND